MAKVEQPEFDIQKKLHELITEEPDEVTFLGKKRKIGWLRNKTIQRFTHITMTEDNEDKYMCKLCAIILLNDVFAWFIPVCYFFYWRWLYRVKNLSAVDALAVIDTAKKKVPHEAFLMVTTLATAMTDLMMAMTKKEVARFQAEHRGDQHTV